MTPAPLPRPKNYSNYAVKCLEINFFVSLNQTSQYLLYIRSQSRNEFQLFNFSAIVWEQFWLPRQIQSGPYFSNTKFSNTYSIPNHKMEPQVTF